MLLTARPAVVFLIYCILHASSPTEAASPRVVASIKPIHALVSAVMAAVGEPQLLMSAAGSPHTFQLKPSGARLLESADAIIWMGPALETFLAKALRTVPRHARVTSLYDAPGVKLLKAHDRSNVHASDNGDGTLGIALDRSQAEIDMHAWLDPANARAMAKHIAATLIAVDPGHGDVYRANADALDLKLAALDRALTERLSSLTHQPYIVFHDAYRYFENRYGLEHLEAIAANPHRPPGAKRFRKTRESIKEFGIECLFVQPQFRPALIAAITEGTNVRIEALDPLGANLEPGPDLYFRLLEGLAEGLVHCLTNSS